MKERNKGAIISIALYFFQIALGLLSFFVFGKKWWAAIFLLYAGYNLVALLFFLFSFVMTMDEQEEDHDDQDYDQY